MKTVKGFAVKGQDRSRLRNPLNGTFEGFEWFVRFERAGVFSWTIGKMSGYDGPTVADVLRMMKKAARAQVQLQEAFNGREVPDEAYNSLRLLYRWERRALQGRLTITHHGKDDKAHYRVLEAQQ
ncbi:MAG: hypothetical protein AB7L09_03205 [Nitrospira sp.]